MLGGVVATKPATQVDQHASIAVREGSDGPDYVSRGAHKLIGALDAFGLDVSGRLALDAGASTGGFSDVLLRRGVAAVAAVDVGYGQLAWPVRSDERVTVLERTNIRDLTLEMLPFSPDLVVGDLSFISLALVLPPLVAVSVSAADLVLMVKPQFEVGKDQVGAGGVVRDPALRALQLGVVDVVASPLPGPSGNVEYFLHLRRGAPALDDDELRRAIEEGPQ